MFRSKVLPGSFLTLLAATGWACDRTPEARPSPPSPPPAAASASASVPNDTPPTSYRLPGSARLVAIGDIHGDLKALRAALRLAGAINGDDDWIGKDLTVVQTGDQVDRGDQDREVLDVLEKLEGAARAAGGALHVLNGNHELMQANFDFRYVTRRSFESFRGFRDEAQHGHALPAFAERLPPEERGRAAAFAPGRAYAQKLAKHLTVAVVGDSLFAHGGVLPAHVDYGLSRINREASDFLSGKRADLSKALASEDSPVWTREFGSPEIGADTCAALGRVLQQVGAKRLIVGHTVQKGGISSACQDRLFRIDVGLSAYYGDNPVQVLEVTASGARVLTAGATSSSPGPATKKSAPSDSALHSPP
jgi:hypothetical protein